jgi:shikimate dehydrogenase
MNTVGLIGYPLTHSFSHRYFTEKFERENIFDFHFLNFQLDNISELPEMIKNTPTLIGFSVTIPYKEKIIPFLDEISPEATEIGAVNAVVVLRKEEKYFLKGFNTDIFGFTESLRGKLSENTKSALILGTGGSAKAVNFALTRMGISSDFVTRNSENINSNCILYKQLDEDCIKDNLLIINATPIGMYPKTDEFPNIPYQYIGKNHLLFDLTYNPPKTKFLEKGESQGAKIINGYEMLVKQAEKSWEIFLNHQ